MRSESPKSLDKSPLCRPAGHTRSLLAAVLAAGTMTACGDDGPVAPDPKGWACVSVQNQKGENMSDCTFEYTAPAEGEANNKCDDDQLFVYGSPGSYTIEGECGQLAGEVEVNISKEGDNGDFETRLIDSLCYNDEQEIVTDYAHRTKDLAEVMGRSTDSRCANWFTDSDTRKAEISALSLTCETWMPEGSCNPVDGRDFLKVLGVNGQYMNDKPIHLTVEAAPEMVPAGREVTVKVTIRELTGAEQEIDVPVIIKGDPTVPAGDGGSDAR